MMLSSLNKLSRQGLEDLSPMLLIKAIRLSNEAYHTKGKPILKDTTYDALKDILRDRKPTHPLLKEVGAKIKRGKVPLPFPMFSLSKLKPENEKEFAAWIKKFPGPYVISDKKDGSSLELIYKDKVLDSAYTRGDGVKGQNVIHNVAGMRVPKKVSIGPMFAVRAETVMTEKNFATKINTKQAKREYKNPRNLIAGLLNTSAQNSDLLVHADVMAFEQIFPRVKPSKAFQTLKAQGFKIPWYKKTPTLSLEMLSALFQERKKKSLHEIDGLVVEQDKINKRPPAGEHSPDYAFAFKMDLDGDIVTTKVLGVDWEISKHGTLKPVVMIQPVNLKGVTVKQASGHNAFFIKNGFRSKDKNKELHSVKPIGRGAVVQIKRSGDVIPHIISVIKAAPKAEMPKIPYTWNATNIDIVAKKGADSESDDLMRDKRITAFFTTLQVDGIKLGVVQQLTAVGMTSIIKILRASKEDFLEIPGFKERKADKLYNEIRAKTRAVELPTLMDGSGMFGAGFGTRRLTMIIKEYPNVLSWGEKSPEWIEGRVIQVAGFQTNTAKKFAKGLPKFIKWLRISKIKPVLPKATVVKGKKFKDQTIVFTGFRDASLESTIKEQGGIIGSGVNKNTTVLVVKDTNSGSSKISKARSLGVSIMTPTEFIAKFKI